MTAKLCHVTGHGWDVKAGKFIHRLGKQVQNEIQSQGQANTDSINGKQES